VIERVRQVSTDNRADNSEGSLEPTLTTAQAVTFNEGRHARPSRYDSVVPG